MRLEVSPTKESQTSVFHKSDRDDKMHGESVEVEHLLPPPQLSLSTYLYDEWQPSFGLTLRVQEPELKCRGVILNMTPRALRVFNLVGTTTSQIPLSRTLLLFLFLVSSREVH